MSQEQDIDDFEESAIVCEQCRGLFMMDYELFYAPGSDKLCFNCRRENFEEVIGYEPS